jgi:hypothetical protein
MADKPESAGALVARHDRPGGPGALSGDARAAARDFGRFSLGCAAVQEV